MLQLLAPARAYAVKAHAKIQQVLAGACDRFWWAWNVNSGDTGGLVSSPNWDQVRHSRMPKTLACLPGMRAACAMHSASGVQDMHTNACMRQTCSEEAVAACQWHLRRIVSSLCKAQGLGPLKGYCACPAQILWNKLNYLVSAIAIQPWSLDPSAPLPTPTGTFQSSVRSLLFLSTVLCSKHQPH
jgi:hypothetical protein